MNWGIRFFEGRMCRGTSVPGELFSYRLAVEIPQA